MIVVAEDEKVMVDAAAVAPYVTKHDFMHSEWNNTLRWPWMISGGNYLSHHPWHGRRASRR
jgi:hypothetical protein